MPWQKDGRRWHTVDRLAHNGNRCRWEGEALAHVIDALEEFGGFAPFNWNHRTTVEVLGERKQGGWFLHALTGDEWLLALKFRVTKDTFDQDKLRRELALKSLDDLDELPIYGRGERVRVKKLKGPWQEVTVTVHWLREIDTPAFRRFLSQAREAYFAQINKAGLNAEDLTPWKVLGRKWHLSRKGFPSGKRVSWGPEVLDELLNLIERVAPQASVDWGNKQVVYFRAGAEGEHWAAIHTKRRGGIDVQLSVPSGQVALGRIAEFGSEREIAPSRGGREAVKIRFDKLTQIQQPALRKFLSEQAPQK
jgi:excinuclease ABC subunit A